MVDTISRGERIQEVLRTLRASSSDVLGASIVSVEGFVIASVLPSDVDEELVSGMGAALLGVSERITEELMQAEMSQVYVRSPKGFIVLNSAGPDSVLVVLTTPDAKLGLVFLDIKHSLTDLTGLL